MLVSIAILCLQILGLDVCSSRVVGDSIVHECINGSQKIFITGTCMNHPLNQVRISSQMSKNVKCAV
jgi:hypothetical protein